MLQAIKCRIFLFGSNFMGYQDRMVAHTSIIHGVNVITDFALLPGMVQLKFVSPRVLQTTVTRLTKSEIIILWS